MRQYDLGEARRFLGCSGSSSRPLGGPRGSYRALEVLPYYRISVVLKEGNSMPRNPIDLEAVRRADARLA